MNEPRKVYVKSFGCQMNVYDSRRMADTLAPEGYVETVLAEVLATLGRASDVVCYLCGNPRMIASATDRLLALGVPAGSIVTERYWAPEGVAA